MRSAETIWKFHDFAIIRSLFEVIFSQDVAKEGRSPSGIRYVPLKLETK